MTRDVATPTYGIRAVYSTWPFWLSLIGGVLIMIEGVVLAVVGPILLSGAADLGMGMLAFGIVVFILGAIIVWGAYSLRTIPIRHVIYGAIIVIASILALVIAGGGFVIGSIFGIVGGAWAIMKG